MTGPRELIRILPLAVALAVAAPGCLPQPGTTSAASVPTPAPPAASPAPSSSDPSALITTRKDPCLVFSHAEVEAIVGRSLGDPQPQRIGGGSAGGWCKYSLLGNDPTHAIYDLAFYYYDSIDAATHAIETALGTWTPVAAVGDQAQLGTDAFDNQHLDVRKSNLLIALTLWHGAKTYSNAELADLGRRVLSRAV